MRQARAIEELASNPEVQWYVARSVGQPNADSLLPQTQGTTLRVAWSVTANDAEAHLRLIPVLCGWTNWKHDAPWASLRRGVASAAAAATCSDSPRLAAPTRHQRLTLALDFVGRREMAAGRSLPETIRILRTVATGISAGTVRVVFASDGTVDRVE